MADNNSLSSPILNSSRPIPALLGSPKFFGMLLAKDLSDTETLTSPNSILDGQSLTSFGSYPFGYDKNLSKPTEILSENNHPVEKLDPKGIGLALVDSLNDEKLDDHLSKHNRKTVLFASKLNIKIPLRSALSPAESPKSPADFGIKTRNSQLSPFGSFNQRKDSPLARCGSLSLSEMELSEDYTCIISRGPNPKTTHIYDNCIVDSCCDAVGVPELKEEFSFSSKDPNSSSEKKPLDSCFACSKILREG